MPPFEVRAPFAPAGDQPRAIAELRSGLDRGERYQTLLGVTGSGKTMTLAHVLAEWRRPTLVLSHNKTLAAQLYGELKQFLPANAVEYFVSYYDYYQPEAYVPSTDVYIEKDASINQDLEALRLRATSSLMERDDVVIVSTVSAIYGLGDPAAYRALMVSVARGEVRGRNAILGDLVDIQYQRNDAAFEPGTFRVRGDTIEIFPAYDEQGVRIELWGDQVERITRFHPVSGQTISQLDRCAIYPAKHFVMQRPTVERAVQRIRAELAERLRALRTAGKLLEAQRLESRTTFDVEMLLEVGTCAGVENYSRHLSGRAEGERPACLLDYFPADFLVVVDESHVSLPQIGGMYNGDRARKEVLVEYGFRLPSALDNRPLRFDEFMQLVPRLINVSATPGDLELELSRGRCGGAGDPPDRTGRSRRSRCGRCGARSTTCLSEIRRTVARRERVLVTTLTKRMAEDLTDYLQQAGVRVRYLHSDIDAIERVEILRGLRLGDFDVLVGINLLREGLDLPEVSLVAILDADQEGFLRSDRSLIQTVRPRRPQRQRARDPLCRSDDRVDAARARRDDPAPRPCSGTTTLNTASRRCRSSSRSTRCASSTHVADQRTERAEPRRRDAAPPRRPARSGAARRRHGRAGAADARGRRQPRVRARRDAARPAQRSPRRLGARTSSAPAPRLVRR